MRDDKTTPKRRTVMRSTRLTQAENAAIEAVARRRGVSVSDLIRKRLAPLLRSAKAA